MKYTLNSIIAFVAGAAVGSLVTWKVLKAKCAEEVEAMREAISYKESRSDKAKDETPGASEEERKEYESEIHKLGYDAGADIFKRDAKEAKRVKKPYVIPPEDYNELYEYDAISLTYYEDGVLADDEDKVIEDVDDIVGCDSLTHFGEYEDDSVFVRNEERKCDYEILRSPMKYSDVVGSPHPTEG